jgi:hypothetical protein
MDFDNVWDYGNFNAARFRLPQLNMVTYLQCTARYEKHGQQPCEQSVDNKLANRSQKLYVMLNKKTVCVCVCARERDTVRVRMRGEYEWSEIEKQRAHRVLFTNRFL